MTGAATTADCRELLARFEVDTSPRACSKIADACRETLLRVWGAADRRFSGDRVLEIAEDAGALLSVLGPETGPVAAKITETAAIAVARSPSSPWAADSRLRHHRASRACARAAVYAGGPT